MVAITIGCILASKYRVDRVIGSGGMGVVVAATHMELDEVVAIKLLHGGQNEEVVARFMREGRIAARIKSEHVVRVRDVGRLDAGTPYMVMELLEGIDLQQMCDSSRGPLAVTAAVDYVLQACEALDEAHRLGVVHRDLKPSNLFLTHRRSGTPCVKILDFGISKVENDRPDAARTSTKDVFGSPAYMSPEQLESTADVDARSDVWSIAAVLYELLTGRPPFEGASLATLHVAILQKPAPDVRTVRPDVPEGVARAILAALEKKRENRTPSIAAFAAALAPFASAVGAEAYRAIGASQHSRPSLPHVQPPGAPSEPIQPTRYAPLVAPGVPPADLRPIATQGTFTGRADAGQPSRRTMALAFAGFGLLAGIGIVAIAAVSRTPRDASSPIVETQTASAAEPPPEETAPPTTTTAPVVLEPAPPVAIADAGAPATPRTPPKPPPIPKSTTTKTSLPDDRR